MHSIVAVGWIDNKAGSLVQLTAHRMDFFKRRVQNKKLEIVDPKVVVNYSKYMGESTGWVVWVWGCESQVMGLSRTQWTGTLYWARGQLDDIASCLQGSADTIDRWKNGPAYSS
jgi:hypothetical protein